MDYSSLILSKNTLSRVNMLMDGDFQAFKSIKSQSLVSRGRQKIRNFFAKKGFLYAGILLAAFLLPSIETSVAAQEIGEKKTFIATAYYSPLPNQEKYYRGSYEADKRLNGEGTTASDGTPVFVGLIAAPKNYAFGTKIALDGLGVVSVHDRGGAIVSADNGVAYDRIDIWMGYGDEGLERTLEWGRREITGTIVSRDTPVSLDLQNIVKNAPQVTQVALQKLQALGYETTGKSFVEVILDFQLKNGIVASVSDAGAGNYGPKTTAKLNELYSIFQKTGVKPVQTMTAPITENKTLDTTVQFIENTKSDPNAENAAMNMRTGFFGKYDEKVKNLQNFLIKMNYDTAGETGIMNLETLHALRRYQHARGIAETGRVDLVTQIKIENDLKK